MFNFPFYFISNRNSCKQTMASDAGLIRVYTVASDLGLHCDV